jgi:hypothetical protein
LLKVRYCYQHHHANHSRPNTNTPPSFDYRGTATMPTTATDGEEEYFIPSTNGHGIEISIRIIRNIYSAAKKASVDTHIKV